MAAPGSLFRSPLLQRTALAAVVALGLINVWGMRPYVVEPALTANDYTADYVSAREWFDGGDPYAELPGLIDEHLGPDAEYFASSPGYQRNAHPPALILVLSPLAFLPFFVARGVVLVLMAALFVASAGWLARRLGWAPGTAAVAAVGVLAVPVVQSDLLFAQINALVLVLMLFAWRSIEAGRDARAGIALGVATALKFFPGFLILALVRHGRWRAAGWQVAAAAALTLAGTLALGVDATRRFISPASTESASYWGPAPHNKSLTAIPGRWLTDNFWFDSADLPAFAAILTALVLGGCVVAALRTRARLGGDPLWGAVPWMLLAAPLSWDHYLALLLPCAFFAIDRSSRLERRWAIAGIAAVAVALLGNVPASTIFDATGLSDVSVAGHLLAWMIPAYALAIYAYVDARAPERYSL